MKHLLKNRRAVTAFTKAIGCELSQPQVIFYGVYSLTNGYPCDDCSYNNNCAAVKTFNKEDSKTVAGAWVKTNAEIAQELGVTKRQASKLKRRSIDTYI